KGPRAFSHTKGIGRHWEGRRASSRSSCSPLLYEKNYRLGRPQDARLLESHLDPRAELMPHRTDVPRTQIDERLPGDRETQTLHNKTLGRYRLHLVHVPFNPRPPVQKILHPMLKPMTLAISHRQPQRRRMTQIMEN